MKFTTENLERLTLAQMQEFIEGCRDLEFTLEGRTAAHSLIEVVLRAQRYRSLSKGQRGIVRYFLAKATGLSRAQLTRLVSQVSPHPYPGSTQLQRKEPFGRPLHPKVLQAHPALESNFDFRLTSKLENAVTFQDTFGTGAKKAKGRVSSTRPSPGVTPSDRGKFQ